METTPNHKNNSNDAVVNRDSQQQILTDNGWVHVVHEPLEISKGYYSYWPAAAPLFVLSNRLDLNSREYRQVFNILMYFHHSIPSVNPLNRLFPFTKSFEDIISDLAALVKVQTPSYRVHIPTGDSLIQEVSTDVGYLRKPSRPTWGTNRTFEHS